MAMGECMWLIAAYWWTQSRVYSLAFTNLQPPGADQH